MAGLSWFAFYQGQPFTRARTASKTRRRIRWLSPDCSPARNEKKAPQWQGNPVTSQSGKQSRQGWEEGLYH